MSQTKIKLLELFGGIGAPRKRPYFDDFGNLNSIISKERKCFFCGSSEELEIHHVFGGSLRDKSTEFGLYVFLCPSCHRKLHSGPDSRKMSDFLKGIAQERFERSHTHAEFMERFHANWPLPKGTDIKDMDL